MYERSAAMGGLPRPAYALSAAASQNLPRGLHPAHAFDRLLHLDDSRPAPQRGGERRFRRRRRDAGYRVVREAGGGAGLLGVADEDLGAREQIGRLPRQRGGSEEPTSELQSQSNI